MTLIISEKVGSENNEVDEEGEEEEEEIEDEVEEPKLKIAKVV